MLSNGGVSKLSMLRADGATYRRSALATGNVRSQQHKPAHVRLYPTRYIRPEDGLRVVTNTQEYF